VRAPFPANQRFAGAPALISLTALAIQKRLRVNQFIRVPQVRLIDEQNNQLGVVATSEALRLSVERGYDLVEVAPNAAPPVCRLLDYGAYQYQLEKTERKSRARQKKVDVKGVRLSLKIGTHDFEHRVNQSKKFFEEGHKVRVELMLRGREKAHAPLAIEIIEKFRKQLGDDVVVDQALSRQGGKMFMIVRKK
jgi:translation initiation factor IF-3